MIRWATSRFNDAALYFAHGTDNAWDEALSLTMQALHLPHSLSEHVGDSMLSSRLTKSEREKIAELVLKRVQTRCLCLTLPTKLGFAACHFTLMSACLSLALRLQN